MLGGVTINLTMCNTLTIKCKLFQMNSILFRSFSMLIVRDSNYVFDQNFQISFPIWIICCQNLFFFNFTFLQLVSFLYSLVALHIRYICMSKIRIVKFLGKNHIWSCLSLPYSVSVICIRWASNMRCAYD